MTGGREDYLEKTDTENECASLVMARKSSATGATWGKQNARWGEYKYCYAENGNRIVSDSEYRTCLFTAGNNF